jgi:hypothetical protein
LSGTAARLRIIDPVDGSLKTVRPELVEGWAGFDRLSPNGVKAVWSRAKSADSAALEAL